MNEGVQAKPPSDSDSDSDGNETNVWAMTGFLALQHCQIEVIEGPTGEDGRQPSHWSCSTRDWSVSLAELHAGESVPSTSAGAHGKTGTLGTVHSTKPDVAATPSRFPQSPPLVIHRPLATAKLLKSPQFNWHMLPISQPKCRH